MTKEVCLINDSFIEKTLEKTTPSYPLAEKEFFTCSNNSITNFTMDDVIVSVIFVIGLLMLIRSHFRQQSTTINLCNTCRCICEITPIEFKEKGGNKSKRKKPRKKKIPRRKIEVEADNTDDEEDENPILWNEKEQSKGKREDRLERL